MDSLVIILSIFLVISLGFSIFLFMQNKKSQSKDSHGHEINQQITETIEKIYKKTEEDFKTTSKESIENVIEPFRKRIKEFEEEVRKNTEQQNVFHATTKQSIEGLIEKTNQITNDANELTKALKGDSKTQGDYGEMKLEMLLENSGLEKDVHYKLQKNFMVDDDDGTKTKRQRPDAIIELPQNRQIVIDSKFSFGSYNEYCAADLDEERDRCGKEIVKNLKARITELSETKYSEIDELNTPDMTFMFVGIDDTLSVALKYDRELTTFANKKKIALLSPTSLHISIKMVEELWRLDTQSKQISVIYEEAQKLAHKFDGFADTMDGLENSIAQSQKKFGDAKNKLIDGSGSIKSRVQKMVKLGSKEVEKLDSDD